MRAVSRCSYRIDHPDAEGEVLSRTMDDMRKRIDADGLTQVGDFEVFELHKSGDMQVCEVSCKVVKGDKE